MARILVVDDDATIRLAYQIALQQAGHVVDVAVDGVEGLKLVQANTYKVILLDLIMPHMGGLEFVQHFQPQEHPETKVVIFSNSSAEKDAQAAIKAGAVRYLLKSHYTPTETIKLIDELVKS
jgi:CheY-like chemotaxis protein